MWLIYDFLSLKNDVNVASKSNKQKNLVAILKVSDENRQAPDPNPDWLVRGTDPRIGTKMSSIRKTDFNLGLDFETYWVVWNFCNTT